MKIEVDKKDLQTLLGKTQNIVEKRTTMPVLVNVLLEARDGFLKVFATDLEVSLTDQIEANIEQDGRVVVNAKSLFDIIKELPEGPTELERQDNHWLKVKQPKAQFNIVGIAPEEYPVFPTYSVDKFLKIQSAVLSEMIEKTIYSVSTDETRYHLNGVYFQRQSEADKGATFRMVATDGHRLSLIDKILDAGSSELKSDGVIIPRKGLNEIKKVLDQVDGEVEIAIEGAQLVLQSGSTILMIRLIEGKYPNYQQLIPQQLKQRMVIKTSDLKSSLKRVSLLSNQKSKVVTLDIQNGKLQITSNNPELGDAKEELEVDYSGEPMKVGFNAKYILDVLNSVNDEVIHFELNDQLSPGIIRPEQDQGYTCVVMPMRI